MKESNCPGMVCLFAGFLTLFISRDASSAFPQNLPRNPNVIIILADDLGWGDIVTYNPASKLSLPNIERLASQGMRFTDAHSTGAHCMPTRYSLLSGNYAWRGRLEYGNAGYLNGSQFLAGQWTIGDALKQAGYITGFVGKAHIGGLMYQKNSNVLATYNQPEDELDFSRSILEGPRDHDFDYSFTVLRSISESPFALFLRMIFL